MRKIYVDKLDLLDLEDAEAGIGGERGLAFWSPDESARFCTAFVPAEVAEDLLEALEPLLGRSVGDVIFGIENCVPNPEWLAKVKRALEGARELITSGEKYNDE